jgi:hypothetical protein
MSHNSSVVFSTVDLYRQIFEDVRGFLGTIEKTFQKNATVTDFLTVRWNVQTKCANREFLLVFKRNLNNSTSHAIPSASSLPISIKRIPPLTFYELFS